MNDAACPEHRRGALDRDIERLLAVEPSPAFVARVRTRIAEAPLPSSRSFGWLFAGAASAVVAAVVLAVVMLRLERRVEPAHGLLTSRSVTGSVVVPMLIERLGRERRTTNAEPRTTNLERPSSEPLFDPRETMALQRLIAGVREARVDLAPLAHDAPMPLPSLDDLVIPPIAIQPLAPGGVEGVRP